MIWTGLDRIARDNFASLAGRRVGLVSHPAALSANYRTAAELFHKNTRLVALFGPEHGFDGTEQDLVAVADSASAVPIYSLYGEDFNSLKPRPEMLQGLDLLVVDLQDVGSRYYTFHATMYLCMEACAEAGLPVMVLDRPNPLGRDVEGPTIREGFGSFVGIHPLAIRHGLTMGELARLYRAERFPNLELTVVPYESGASSERLWFPPSPNMPTAQTARVYPGSCLFEGTNLSEGRGTTRPFEFVGFPGVNADRLAERLRNVGLPDVEFLPVSFRPTFHKHAGHACGGVFIHPTGSGFRPVRTGLAILIAFRKFLGGQFRWRTERYEFVDQIPAIDLLFGSDRERLQIDRGADWQSIAANWITEEQDFLVRRAPFLIDGYET